MDETARDPETVDSIHLIREAQGGEHAALNRLFERYYARVRAVVRRRLGPALRRDFESGDLLHEALIQAFRSFDRYELRSHAEFLDWLAGIVEHRIRAAHEYVGRDKRDRDCEVALEQIRESVASGRLVLEPSLGGVDRAIRDEERQLVWDALEELPAHYRQAVVLRHFHRASWEQVAEATGRRSADAARMLYVRARRDLEKRVAGRLRG